MKENIFLVELFPKCHGDDDVKVFTLVQESCSGYTKTFEENRPSRDAVSISGFQTFSASCLRKF